MKMLDEFERCAMMAIIRSDDESTARELGLSLVSAGVSILEFTTTCPNVYGLIEEFSQKSVSVGVGTAITKEHVQSAHKAGASFIVSPHTDSEIIKETKKLNLLSVPGVATATEVATAQAAGADLLKLFPASTYGSSHLKALRDPFPNLRWMATGGISSASVGEWFAAGALGFGLGGPLIKGGISHVQENVEKFRSAIETARLAQQ